VPACALAVVFLLAPAALVGVFTDDAAVIRDGTAYLRAAAVAQLAAAFENVLEGGLTGAGYTFYTMLAVVGISALRIPLAGLVAGPFGLDGIWWMLALTAMGRAVAMTGLWHWGRWERARA
jgi:Na+-driven multidrug efflux pump